MIDQSILKFPSVLASARREAKLSQKALALSSGLDQSYVCGVEKGRRTTPRPDAVEALAEALGHSSDSKRLEEFRWAAAHDRVLHVVATQGLLTAAPSVSAVLRASRCLSAAELAGLLNDISRAIESRLHLGQLARGGHTVTREEVPM